MKRLLAITLLIMTGTLCLWKLGTALTGQSDSLEITWEIAGKPTLVLGVIPYVSNDSIRKELNPLIAYLAAHLDRPVQLVIATDYERLKKLLDYGKVHLAWFSSTSYDKLNTENAWEVTCRPVRSGSVFHRGIIITQASGTVKTLFDLRGKTFAYVDRNSGTGFIYPNHIFIEHGIDPLSFFGKVVFTGNHTNSIDGVLDGTYDAAAVFNLFIENQQYQPKLASLTILYETNLLLNDPIVVRKDMDSDLKKRLADYLVNMASFPDGLPVLEHLQNVRKWENFISEENARQAH